MSLYESLESNGSVSLKELFDGHTEIESMSELTIENIAQAICRGGWPAAVKTGGPAALRMATNYVEAVINMDVQRVDGIEKNPERVRMLLRSLARNVATMATAQTIKADVEANDMTISEKTLAGYLNALRRIFVVEDMPAWQPLAALENRHSDRAETPFRRPIDSDGGHAHLARRTARRFRDVRISV